MSEASAGPARGRSGVSSFNDPAGVREEYASERGLATRASVYRWSEGPDAASIAFAAVAEAAPRRVLDAGCGRGQLAERIARELRASVIGLDQSERMVELTRARGVDAVVADVQELPFVDAEFDCAVAAWMLYHVPDVERALAELARVLRPGGRLVAVTNGVAHMRELRELLGLDLLETPFSAENGAELLGRHFRSVERRDASGTVLFPDRDSAQTYVDATRSMRGSTLPAFEGPLRVTRAPYVFVAEA